MGFSVLTIPRPIDQAYAAQVEREETEYRKRVRVSQAEHDAAILEWLGTDAAGHIEKFTGTPWRAVTFYGKTKEAVQAEMDRYLEQYPRFGFYLTNLLGPYAWAHGFKAHGERWA